MNQKLSKGIIIVFTANIINLFFNIFTNFLLPKYLSIDSYSNIKMYQFYVSYVGIFHLGYIDGMYLKYGGKQRKEINQNEFNDDVSTLRIFQILISILISLVGLIFKDSNLFFFGIAILPLNMCMYFKSFYQAIGEFSYYAHIINATVGLNFSINLIGLLILKTDKSIIYILGYIAVSYFISFYIEYKGRKNVKNLKLLNKFSKSNFKNNIKTGILLMVGNLSSLLLTGMDRWFIKILLLTSDFAYYSFAVSVESLINVAITPISTTLYNYFCTHKEKDKIIIIRKLVIIFAFILIVIVYPVKFILAYFIPKYTSSFIVIELLFLAQIFYIPVQAIYLNLYKAFKMQKIYLKKLIIVLAVGFFSNIGFYLVWKTKEAFAVGTLLTGAVWLKLSIKDFKQYPFEKIETLFMCIGFLLYIITGIIKNSIYGGLIYFIGILTAIFIFYKDYIIQIINNIKKFKNR